MTTPHKATMSFSDGTPSVDFPIYKGTVGPDVVCLLYTSDAADE